VRSTSFQERVWFGFSAFLAKIFQNHSRNPSNNRPPEPSSPDNLQKNNLLFFNISTSYIFFKKKVHGFVLAYQKNTIFATAKR
jgi:hypothetical protein